MNVIIANKYKDILSTLDIDVIKKMDGEFDIDTITSTFANFYFNRMILDITALQNYFDINTIQKLSTNLDASKIILLLDDDPRINNSYLSKIISLGIYNFTNDLTGIKYLMDNPNSYRDVAQYHDLAMQEQQTMNQVKASNELMNQNSFVANTYGPRIIGFKDLTPDAGATTLVYMLKKQIQNRKVLAVEINNNDFSYFKDSELLSTTSDNIANLKSKMSNFDLVLIDLNNSDLDKDGTCSDVIYLLEPSTIKLNKLIRHDNNALINLKSKKIVLNKSLLTLNDVREFEYEAKITTFYNIPPLDERKDHQMVLDSFLAKLGLLNENENTNSGFFSFFKKN